ncbi:MULTISPECIES: phospholipid carrier-dependent glycosyltransferase [Cyanophyceae]|uniref:phospholipid carrier-dependent glycosyltransferase n=1 Tax=Cyanophyceae TaxID=3028117 RepID=UPI0016856DDF|nr:MULTISPECIES: phospholipid carrier-dependent glycosyltransferase [unclassified Phormidium]MBD1916200.1 phospholipid carrier-dependent glycosyltransferase [Phormidium sp. FACHB-77]MBD2052842.1 phospholipid carrier-dependent glycosyltransferase [Leptolyngbya sp. FACHB-60]
MPLWSWMLGLGAIALSLRLAGLGRIHGLVFDEVYYVPFALNYLQGTPSFDAHPPLAKYLIALGIWLVQWPTAWLGWPTVEVEGALVSPLAFRWLNAIVGATIPILLAALAFALSRGYLPQRRRSFALLAGLLMAMEGLTLVESRLALINIYGLALGLLGQWAWVSAGQAEHPSRWRWAAGIALGAAINVKWNWAGLWLGLLLWEVLTIYGEHRSRSPLPKSLSLGERDFNVSSGSPSPWRRGWGMRANPWPRQVAYLGVIPLATYMLLWLPHLALTGESLLSVHRQLWSTHQSIGAGAGHDYCSPWHSWPLMVRPVAYFYERAGQGSTATATTIHAMGNPVLWWLGTAAVLALGLGWLSRRVTGENRWAGSPNSAVVPFILLNYLTNWLPWALVSRCTFLYHAMGMAAVSTLGLAWLIAQWWQNPRDRPLALVLLGAIALSFLFWLPLYLGMPLSLESLHRRWLLPGWI